MKPASWPVVASYIAALVCATYLTAMGKLPTELLAAMFAVALPSPFAERKDPPS